MTDAGNALRHGSASRRGTLRFGDQDVLAGLNKRLKLGQAVSEFLDLIRLLSEDLAVVFLKRQQAVDLA